MNKYLTLLVGAASLFVFLGFSVNADARRNGSKILNPKPTPKNKIAIRDVSLDRANAELRCDNGITLREGAVCAEDPSIKITTSVNNPKNAEITYYYMVTGGKIVGQGANVSWDFRGARPGTYTVTVGIGDKSKIFGETITKTVQIRDCPTCDPPCVCPTVEVYAGGMVRAGENVKFTAEVMGGSDTSDPTYKWTVSQGEIISGQGTREITVKTTKEMSGAIKATVEFSSPGLCAPCAVVTASETATIVK